MVLRFTELRIAEIFPVHLENKTQLFRRIQQDILLTFNKKFGDFNTTLVIGNTIWDRYSNTQLTSVGNGVGDIPTAQVIPHSQQTSGLTLPGIYNLGYPIWNL